MSGNRECPLCHSRESDLIWQVRGWESFDREEIYEIRRCRECGLTFTAPFLDEEALGRFYAQGLYRDTPNRLNWLVAGLSRLFQWARLRKIRRLKRTGRLLDVGCGKGRFISYIAARGWDVQGVEPSEARRKASRERLLRGRVVGTLEDVDAGEKFDVVTFWHVLEHIPRPVETLRKALKHLKEDGFLLVAVPNLASLQARIGGKHWIHLDVPRHRFHFTPETLGHVLKMAGFEMVRVDHFSLEFNPLGVLQTVLNLLGCEPGLIYRFIKRDLSWEGAKDKLRFIYSALVAFLGIPLLLLPSFLFAWLESAMGRGGTIVAYARPAGKSPKE